MAITGKRRRQSRGGSKSQRGSNRDTQPVTQDSHSPVGGMPSHATGSFYLSDTIGTIARRRSARLCIQSLNFKRRLWHYLVGHCEGLADDMWDKNSFEMRLDFHTIRAHHEFFSDEIILNHKKMGAEANSALVAYLKVQFMKKSYTEKFEDLHDMVQKITYQAKIIFENVPNRIEPLDNAFDLPLSGPSKRYRILFAKHPKRKYRVPIATDTQLLILIGSLDHLLQNHKKGKAWGGAWTRKDWMLFDGKPCLRAAGEPANQASCKLDLGRFATEFIFPFAHKDGRYPANMVSLFEELSRPEELPDDEFFGWYYEFLSFHPCLYTGSARRMLVTGWYHLVEYLRFDQRLEYKAVFDDALPWTGPFRIKNSPDKVIWLVFWDGETPSVVLPYGDTLGHNFRLIRQVQEHVYRCIKLIGDIQTAERSDEADLYAEDQFPHVLALLIKRLFSERRMVGQFLEEYENFKKLRGPQRTRGG